MHFVCRSWSVCVYSVGKTRRGKTSSRKNSRLYKRFKIGSLAENFTNLKLCIKVYFCCCSSSRIKIRMLTMLSTISKQYFGITLTMNSDITIHRYKKRIFSAFAWFVSKNSKVKKILLYLKEVFKETVYNDLDTLKKFVINYHNEYG